MEEERNSAQDSASKSKREMYTPQHNTYVEAEIAVVDYLLLNAYGTVYKMAAKYLNYRDMGYELSLTAEMLLTKNVVTNLWSVLDYCCKIFRYQYAGPPTPEEARMIKFPCDHKVRGFMGRKNWESWRLREIFPYHARFPHARSEGVFSEVQINQRDYTRAQFALFIGCTFFATR